MEDILQAFSRDVEQSLDRALRDLQQQENHGTEQPKNHDPNYQATKSQLQNLWHLETVLHELIARRILDTQRQLRDFSMSFNQSHLLSLSSEVLQVLASFLEETGLWALEQATKDILNSKILEQKENGTRKESDYDPNVKDDHILLDDHRIDEFIITDQNLNDSSRSSIPDEPITKFGEDWNDQWVLLDRKRHSKSLQIGTSPRTRGVRFAMASHFARQWELQLLKQQQQQYFFHDNNDILVIPAPPNHANKFSIYDKSMYQHDFQTFFDEGHPTPQVEFFIRITYHDYDINNSQVLLEGFQSNFQSLKHTHDAQDQGHHTYIGLGEDHHRNPYQRSQAVMVRNDIHLLKDYMGVSEKYFGLDSDAEDDYEDYEEDSDEDSDASSVEFHFKQWPEASRREFLNHVTITVVRFGRTHNDKDNTPSLMVVGTTTGYDESNQHFAMFRPVQLLSAGIVAENEDEFHNLPPLPLRIGLGCGVGNSLHIVVKWQDDSTAAYEAYDEEDEINVADALVEYYQERDWLD